MKNLALRTITAITLLALAQSAFAITASGMPITSEIPDLEEQIDGSIKPEFPNPGDKVTITLEAYGTDLNRASIRWQVDGAEVQSGKGLKSLSVVAGDIGKKQTITATIVPVNGLPVTKTFYVSPQSIDLIWQSDTYTPPFYRGKAMFTPQEKVTLVAMPNLASGGARVSPSDITYKWKKDFVVQGKVSGYGARTFSYKGDILMQPVNIGLEASVESGDTAAIYTELAPTFPEVYLYEQSPIYGTLYNRGMSGAFDFGTAVERSIAAYPYFFGAANRNSPALAYSWTLNGSPINVAEDQNTMTFRNSENIEGESQIGVSVKNTSNFLEQASDATLINFKKPSKTISL
jgi:hypothetical protein